MTFRTIFGFALGPVGTALLGFTSVPLIAWLFSSEDLGRLNILQTVCSLAMIVFTLGLDQAYMREYHHANDKALLLKQIFLPVFIALSFVTFISLVWREDIISFVFSSEGLVIFISFWMAIWGTLFLRLFSTVLRMQERGWEFSICQLLNRVALIILCLLSFFILEGLNFSVLSLIFSVGVVGSAILAFWLARVDVLAGFRSPMSVNGLKGLLYFGFPLIISGFFYWGLTASGTLALSRLSTLSELGVYSVALSFGAVAMVFQQVFTVVWAPMVYKWLTEELEIKKIEVIAQDVLSLVALLVCCAGVFSWMVDLVLPPEYVKVKFYVLCTIIPPLFYTLSEITAVGIGASRRTWLNVVASSTAFLINMGLCLLLVPEYGAAGAVVSNTLAYYTFLVVRTEVARYVWYKMPRAKVYITSLFLSLGACITVYLGSTGVNYVYAMWLAFLCLTGVSFFRRYQVLTRKALAFLNFR